MWWTKELDVDFSIEIASAKYWKCSESGLGTSRLPMISINSQP